MNSFRSVMEVFKLLPPSTVLTATSHTCGLWARVSLADELWNEFLDIASVSEQIYLVPDLSRKQNYKQHCQAHHKLAVFRERELLVFNCRTEKWRQITLHSFAPAIHCMSAFLHTGDLMCCGGMDIVSGQGGAMELGAVTTAFLFNLVLETETPTSAMLTPRHSHGMLTHQHRVFVFGGANDHPLRSAEQYSTVTSHWTKLPDMHYSRSLFNPCARGMSVYLCGGAECSKMEVFDVETLIYSFCEVTLPATRCWQCTALTLSQDLIYLAGRSIILVKLNTANAVLSKVAPFQCGWQDTNPQVHSLHLYYQQCAGVGKLDLRTYEVQLIELPPVQKVRVILETKKRKRHTHVEGQSRKKNKGQLALCL